jgi:pimeloyl-ACP methyl ester carboxylesterase
MNLELQKEYPFEGKRLDLDGLGYHYLDEGSGPPVVMVHGNPSWSFYYRNLVLALRDRYRCIVPDHIGCGLSDKPGDNRYPYTLSRRVDDLEKLLERLGIRENITLVVHDWGGMIGMAYAVRHPGRIKRLVILNTGAFHLPTSKPFPLALRICRNTFIGTLLVRGYNAFSRAASYVGCKRNPMSDKMRTLYQLPYDSWKNRIATLRFVQDIPLKPGDRAYDLVSSVADGIGQFRTLPMLICWGELDFVFDRHFLAKWRQLFPDAEVHSYPDCGHYILEDASEEVVPLISEFMKRTELM